MKKLLILYDPKTKAVHQIHNLCEMDINELITLPHEVHKYLDDMFGD